MASLARLHFISVEEVANRVITTYYLLETHPTVQMAQSHLASISFVSLLDRGPLSSAQPNFHQHPKKDVPLVIASLSFSLMEAVVSSCETVIIFLGSVPYLEWP